MLSAMLTALLVEAEVQHQVQCGDEHQNTLMPTASLSCIRGIGTPKKAR